MDSGVVQPSTKVALQATVLSSAAPAGGDPSAVAAPAALPLPLPIPGGGMVVVQQVQPAPLVQQQGAAVAASAAALPIASPAELKVGRGCGMCEGFDAMLVPGMNAGASRETCSPWPASALPACRACLAAATPR